MSYFTAASGKTMENDKLKSIVLAAGSIILLFLVATNPGLQKDAIWHRLVDAGRFRRRLRLRKGSPFRGNREPRHVFLRSHDQSAVSTPSIKLVEKAVRNVYDFRKIYPGQRYEVYAADNGDIESLKFSVGDTSYIDINIKDGDISAEKLGYTFSNQLTTASGTITNSLYNAIEGAGHPGGDRPISSRTVSSRGISISLPTCEGATTSG